MSWASMIARAVCVAAASGIVGASEVAAREDGVGPPEYILRRPPGTGRFPAVVLLHGTTGIESSQQQWAGWLTGIGYVTVLVNSKRPGGGTYPDVDVMARDARDAMEHLRTLPFVDTSRVGIVGFSRGGTATLRAVTRLRDAAPMAAGYKAAVVFYPSCSYRITGTAAPLLALLGERDGSPVPCVEMGQRLRAAGASADVVVYPGAYHAFDDPQAPQLTVRRDGNAAWTVMYDSAAAGDAQRRMRAFFETHVRGGR